jgi:hypothetical protein
MDLRLSHPSTDIPPLRGWSWTMDASNVDGGTWNIQIPDRQFRIDNPTGIPAFALLRQGSAWRAGMTGTFNNI